MKTVHKKMLFTAIVGFSAGIGYALLYNRFELLQALWISVTGYFLSLFPAVLSIIASNLKHLKKIILLLFLAAVSPITIYFIGSNFFGAPMLPPLIQQYSFFPFTINLMLSIGRHRHSTNTCSHCYAPMAPGDVFCPSCYKLCPSIQNTFKTFSDKHSLDFVPNNDGWKYRTCPHCQAKYDRNVYQIADTFDTPIQRCKKCGHYFSDNTIIEWMLVPKTKRLCPLLWFSLLNFCSTHILLFGMDILMGIYASQINITAWIITFVVSAIYIFFSIKKDVVHSQSRIYANPEYPKILAHMGYEHLDAQYKNKTP